MQLPRRIINPNTKIVITRRLPTPGNVLVQRGQRVEALRTVAQAEIPSRYRMIDVAHQLGRATIEDMEEVMLKEEGEPVEANEPIAAGKGSLPFWQRTVRAPEGGHIAAIGAGWVLLETGQTTFELQAFVNGLVAKIVPRQGVVIESKGVMIEAACGFGGETYGLLKRLVHRPFDSLTAEAIDENAKNAILLGGRTIDEETLYAAEAAKARGIIVGSIDAALLHLDPPVRVRVVATEGFGYIPMAPYTFGILGTLAGQEVSIRGNTPSLFATGSDSPEIEPPIVLATTTRITNTTLPDSTAHKQPEDIEPGSRVRIIRGSLMGNNGIIDSIPDSPQTSPAGVISQGAYVKINGSSHYIPWANLEEIN